MNSRKRKAHEGSHGFRPHPGMAGARTRAPPHASHASAPNLVVGATRARSAGRKLTTPAQRKADREWMKTRMNNLLKEIDAATGNPITGHTGAFQFLDTCCAPGGFCEFTLASSQQAYGLGFSLNPGLGGHVPAIPFDTPRFHLELADATEIACGLRCRDMTSGSVMPRDAYWLDAGPNDAPTHVVDLIILDGSFLGGKEWISKDTNLPDYKNPAFNIYRAKSESHLALLVAQMVVMGNNLKENGTMLLRLSISTDPFVCGLICMFRRLFSGPIVNFKPRSMHTAASSYYLVAKGFQPELLTQFQWNERLGSLLRDLRAGGSRPRFVPFPGLAESSENGLTEVWQASLTIYLEPLKHFMSLTEAAIKERAHFDELYPLRLREGRFVDICGRHTLLERCNKNPCPQAHIFEELHPLVQQAHMIPLGHMHLPKDVHWHLRQFSDEQVLTTSSAWQTADEEHDNVHFQIDVSHQHLHLHAEQGVSWDVQHQGIEGHMQQEQWQDNHVQQQHWQDQGTPVVTNHPSLWNLPHHNNHAPPDIAMTALQGSTCNANLVGQQPGTPHDAPPDSLQSTMPVSIEGAWYLVPSESGSTAGGVWSLVASTPLTQELSLKRNYVFEGTQHPQDINAQDATFGWLPSYAGEEIQAGVSCGVDLLGFPLAQPNGTSGEMWGVMSDAISGYASEGAQVMVTAGRAALQQVMHFLNGGPCIVNSRQEPPESWLPRVSTTE